jgi:hypothetical protein
MATNFNTVVTSSATNDQITAVGDDALITKDYADANYSGGGGGATVSVAQYGSTNTSTNLNAATFTIVPFNVTDSITDTSNYTISGGRVTITDAGQYLVSSIVTAEMSGIQRARIGIEIFVEGTSTGYRGSQMYLRSSGTILTGSSNVSALVNLSAGDTVDIRSINAGNTGTVTMVSGDSVLSIVKVAGVMEATGVSSATDNTANVSTIDLTKIAGTYYTSTSNTAQYTVATGAVAGGFAHITINKSGSAPTFTNATQLTGADFVASTDMKMIVYNDGVENLFYFLSE